MSERAALPLLDQTLATRISTLRVRARRAVDGIRSGIHRSPHRGASMIFAEHRDYRPGDDLRMLDWRAYARNDRYTIKRFEQETHLRANLLLDVSSSMAYDGGHPEQCKATYAATLLAALGLVLLGQGDAVGAMCFDRDLRKNVPPRSRADHLDVLLGVLGLPPRGAADGGAAKLETALSEIGERVGRRGLVILASDLLDFDERALRPLSNFAALGHELLVFQVLHPDELNLPWKHSVRFEDPEGPGAIDTDADAVRKVYQQELDAFLESCRKRCLALGARYTLVRTDERVESALARALVAGRRT